MGGLMILDMDRVEVNYAGLYYGAGQTNNKAESFTIWDTL